MCVGFCGASVLLVHCGGADSERDACSLWAVAVPSLFSSPRDKQCGLHALLTEVNLSLLRHNGMNLLALEYPAAMCAALAQYRLPSLQQFNVQSETVCVWWNQHGTTMVSCCIKLVVTVVSFQAVELLPHCCSWMVG